MCIQTIGIMADVNEIRGCVYNYLPYYTYHTHTIVVQLSAVLYILYSYNCCTIICHTIQQLLQLMYNYLPYYITTHMIVVQLSTVLYNNSYNYCTIICRTIQRLIYSLYNCCTIVVQLSAARHERIATKHEQRLNNPY